MSLSRSDADIAALTTELGLPAEVMIRAWDKDDFVAIQRLSAAEGWPTPNERPDASLRSWQHSWPALVAIADGTMIGFLRAVSDEYVTIYVAELLVVPEWRGRGIASALLELAQKLCPGTRLDLLATQASREYYERVGFHSFVGYRRNWYNRDAVRHDPPRTG
jgi:GNAT superfamily N-acetyltransferase